MTKGTIFWLLMLLWLIFGAWSLWPRAGEVMWAPIGGSLLLFVLLFLLGWQVFGFIVKDK